MVFVCVIHCASASFLVSFLLLHLDYPSVYGLGVFIPARKQALPRFSDGLLRVSQSWMARKSPT